MKEDEDQFYSQPEQIEDIIPLKQHHEALPPKSPHSNDHRPQLKRIDIPKQKEMLLYRPFRLQKFEEQSEQDTPGSHSQYDSPFTQFYQKEQCIYMRHNNSSFNRIQGHRHYAGQFANRNIFADSRSSQTHQISQILNQYYDIHPPQYQQPSESDPVFDSKFQSGNLFAAFKVSTFQYDLAMSNDTNSTGSNQWFYFSVENLKPHKQYTFAVINFTKRDALFNYGMKPVVYSMMDNKGVMDVEKGWRRMGEEVTYKKSKLPRQYSNRMYYRLSFKISTPHHKDKLLIAHSYPYLYEATNKFITEKKLRCKQYVSRIQVGKTLAKRSIPALVITCPINKKRDNRKAVVVMARQHPGQTQGSYVCEGVIDQLLNRSKESEYLLKNYVFYVIPMVNPDGVVHGHYRTNLAGKDLNRKWDASQKDLNCPQVTAIKAFLCEINQTRQIRFILDLHGHSRKLNSFFYGNPYVQCPEAVRIFPFVCSKIHPGVQYLDCTFATEECKRKAARVYLNYIHKLPHVYTFESSFYAYQKDGNKVELTPKEYRQLGGSLVSALYLQLQHQAKYQQSLQFNLKKNISKQYQSSLFVKYLMELKNNKSLLELGNKEESGSDSKPQEGEINNEELEFNKIPSKATTPLPRENVSKSNKPQRKNYQEAPEQLVSKPTRNLKLLQITKINSFLPDRQFFCLQPLRKQQTQTPSQSAKPLRTFSQSQTQMLTTELIQFPESVIKNAKLSQSFKPEPLKKSVTYTKSLQLKNNIIFKLGQLPSKTERQSLQLNNKSQRDHRKPIFKNVMSQTMISCSKVKKEERSFMFPQIQKEDIQPVWIKSAQIKIQTPFSQIMKKDSDAYFNGMLRRFLEKKAQTRFQEPTAHRSILDKSFSIKRKDSHRRGA